MPAVSVYEVKHLNSGQIFCKNCRYSWSPLFKTRGLLGRDSLAQDEGIWLKPCNAIHMWFMKIPIDAVFLNKKNEIVKIYHNIQPWAMTPIIFKAYSTLEIAANVAQKNGLHKGDQLEFRQL